MSRVLAHATPDLTRRIPFAPAIPSWKCAVVALSNSSSIVPSDPCALGSGAAMRDTASRARPDSVLACACSFVLSDSRDRRCDMESKAATDGVQRMPMAQRHEFSRAMLIDACSCAVRHPLPLWTPLFARFCITVSSARSVSWRLGCTLA